MRQVAGRVIFDQPFVQPELPRLVADRPAGQRWSSGAAVGLTISGRGNREGVSGSIWVWTLAWSHNRRPMGGSAADVNFHTRTARGDEAVH